MFILQDGKLYVQEGKKIIGVDIYSDKITKVKGTEETLKSHTVLTPFEMKSRLNIREDNPYIFPKPKKVEKEVVKDAKSTPKTKKTTGKS